MSDRTGWSIVVTSSAIAGEARDLLAEAGCDVAFWDFTGNVSSPEFVEFLRRQRPHGIIVRKGRLGEGEFSASGRLRVVSKHGVGVDTIDIPAATRLGIVVMNTPGANSQSVAEHALAFMFALARRIPLQDRKVRRGLWDKKGYRGFDLAGKTLGIVGFGRIGRRLAELVAPLPMKVIAHDPAMAPGSVPGVTLVEELRDLLAAADIVSLHCALTPETRGMIGIEEFRLMGKKALFINTARGAIADETAQVRALEEGLIAGAALDTFETEPPAADSPLFRMDNVVLSNHVGGVTVESMRNMGVTAARNVLSVLEGAQIDRANVLNPEVLG
ncbi:MAG: hydroxyacid dehydrogenase [Planctomycetota bacterium]